MFTTFRTLKEWNYAEYWTRMTNGKNWVSYFSYITKVKFFYFLALYSCKNCYTTNLLNIKNLKTVSLCFITGGIYMNFDVLTIQTLRREILRGNSPTDELLTKWGHQNHTILELFVLLSKMQHYQAMLIIKQFVNPEYHRLIYEGEQNLNRLFLSKENSKSQASNSWNQKILNSSLPGLF